MLGKATDTRLFVPTLAVSETPPAPAKTWLALVTQTNVTTRALESKQMVGSAIHLCIPAIIVGPETLLHCDGASGP